MLGLGGSDALVDREGLPQVCRALAGVSVPDVASANSLKCPGLQDGRADIISNAEGLGEVAEGVVIASGGLGQKFTEVDRCRGLAVPVAEIPVHPQCLGQAGGRGLVVAGPSPHHPQVAQNDSLAVPVAEVAR